MKQENYEMKLGGKVLKVQLEGWAEQASGCALLQYGETSVLTTAVMGEQKPEMGFFPLTCDYEERFYAAGKILGSRFIRREGRPSTEAVLNARLIDRAVRPLFPKGTNNEIQVIATCLSWDSENDPAVLGLSGASLALGLSQIPWAGPVAAVRIGYQNEKYILNPNYLEREEGDLDVVFAGVERGGQILINMIEARAEEASEEVFLGAYDFALPYLKQVIDFQNKIIKEKGRAKIEIQKESLPKELENELKKFLKANLEEALYQKGKQKRNFDWHALEEEMYNKFASELAGHYRGLAADLFYFETEKLLKENIFKKQKRPDGRALDEVREIETMVGFLPRTHGSATFRRGETRVLSILTLGAPGDQQLIEGMEVSGKKRFLHHYNFPPYSAGEVRRLTGPGRREIGHGALAEKAILPLLPDIDNFPYTIRIVSESLSSNGSTSMASVCGASLALMDAGVPIKRAAAGIAVGLVLGKDFKDFKLLTDIQGPEDHHGDMDLKAAGTREGITVVQMDVKTDGLTREILEAALEMAKEARLRIIEKMDKTLSQPRKELSPYAPRVYTLQINPDKIGAVIGTGGKVINEIIDECDVSIDIEDDGKVFITAEKKEGADKAIEWIKGLTREFKVGEVFQGKVVRLVDFGAFVEIAPGQDGLVHISEFVPYRLNRVEDVVKTGDFIPVKIKGIDEQGKISLSAKAAGFRPRPALRSELQTNRGRRPYGRKER